MQFTPQQLAGAQKYSSKTRIGNWQEDLYLEEIRNKNNNNNNNKARCNTDKQTSKYEQFQQQQNLLCKDFDTKTNRMNSSSSSILLKSGDFISIRHCFSTNNNKNKTQSQTENNGILSCDPFDDELSLSVAKVNNMNNNNNNKSEYKPIPRNVFQIKSINDDDDIIRWGVPFQIVSCVDIPEKENDCYLISSTLKSERCVSPISYQQLVYLHHHQEAAASNNNNNYNTQWVAIPTSQSTQSTISSASTSCSRSRDELLSKGMPILFGDCLRIKHLATSHFLSTNEKYFGITHSFGTKEYEVSAVANRDTTTQWSFCNYHDMKEKETSFVLRKIITILRHYGRFSIHYLQSDLMQLSHSMDRETFLDVLRDKHQIYLSDDSQYKVLLETYSSAISVSAKEDESDRRSVNVTEFLQDLFQERERYYESLHNDCDESESESENQTQQLYQIIQETYMTIIGDGDCCKNCEFIEDTFIDSNVLKKAFQYLLFSNDQTFATLFQINQHHHKHKHDIQHIVDHQNIFFNLLGCDGKTDTIRAGIIPYKSFHTFMKNLSHEFFYAHDFSGYDVKAFDIFSKALFFSSSSSSSSSSSQ